MKPTWLLPRIGVIVFLPGPSTHAAVFRLIAADTTDPAEIAGCLGAAVLPKAARFGPGPAEDEPVHLEQKGEGKRAFPAVSTGVDEAGWTGQGLGPGLGVETAALGIPAFPKWTGRNGYVSLTSMDLRPRNAGGFGSSVVSMSMPCWSAVGRDPARPASDPAVTLKMAF